MEKKLKEIAEEAKQSLDKVLNTQALNDLKIKYLGKKSELSNVLKTCYSEAKQKK